MHTKAYMPPTEDQVRKKLEKKRRVPQWVWDLEYIQADVDACTEAIDEDDLEECYANLEKRVNDLVTHAPEPKEAPAERLETRRRAAPKERESKTSGIVWRSRAVSALIVADARRRDDVREFRRDVLGDVLLADEEVSEWIEREQKREGPPTGDLSLTVRVTADAATKLMQSYSKKRLEGKSPTLQDFGSLPIKRVGSHSCFIRYGKPGDEWSHCLPVNPDGMLGRLQQLAEKLAKDYHWSVAPAVHFVLADTRPYSGISGTLEYGHVTRVVLSIPPWYSAADVARAYENRRDSFGDLGKSVLSKRPQSIGERVARLVIFRCEHPDADWRELCRLWRERSDIPKEWHYKNKQEMCTAFNRAARTLAKSM